MLEENTSNKKGSILGTVIAIIAAIFAVGIVAGGLLLLNNYLNKEPAFSHHETPPEVTSVKVVKHADWGDIGILENNGKPVLSEVAPAVEITGEWAGAKWVEVSNDREKLGFMVYRPVPGKEGEKYFPKTFWALVR